MRSLHGSAPVVTERTPDDLVDSPLPLFVIDLTTHQIQSANGIAAVFFGVAVAALEGTPFQHVLEPAEVDRTTQALNALQSGAIDAYRTRRTFISADGPIDASLWVRAIPQQNGKLALVLLLPANYEAQFASPIRSAMGPLAVDLAVGATDSAGRIMSLWRSTPRVLTKHGDRSAKKSYLPTQVHPDDQPMLGMALRRFKHDHRDVILPLRVTHEELGWVAAQCHLFSIGRQGSDASIGFVIGESTVTTSTIGRVAQLEGHLARIIDEAQAAGLAQRPVSDDEPRPPVDLSMLTGRQRDIVNRLLDGARVPSIAKSLFISRSTVRNHLSGVYRSLNVHSQAELIELLRPAR
jgi:DNA-binding CsgD family transcriptional regulator